MYRICQQFILSKLLTMQTVYQKTTYKHIKKEITNIRAHVETVTVAESEAMTYTKQRQTGNHAHFEFWVRENEHMCFEYEKSNILTFYLFCRHFDV